MLPPPPRSTLFPYTTLFRSFPTLRRCNLQTLRSVVSSLGAGPRKSRLPGKGAAIGHEGIMQTTCFVLVILDTVCLAAPAQTPPPLGSPEVHADPTSTFRYRRPNVKEDA